MTSRPWYAFYPKDYEQKTAHLSLLEDGAYRRLLDLAYSSDKPLPLDVAQLCRICRAVSSEERKALERVLKEFFTKTKSGYTQQRVKDEIKKAKQIIALRSESGKLGANSRWHGKRMANAMANGQQTDAHPHPHPHPTSTKNGKKIEGIFSKSGVGGNGSGSEHVTIKDPAKRLAIFQKKIAEAIPSNGWMTVIAAADPTAPGHAAALEICKLTAKKLGKGWPTQWPSAE